jgi:SAM-dependent methyltransferase
MKEFWDSRYAEEAYAYGITPNAFLKETLERYKVGGKILFPAEGEGRNAVYAAQQGLEVTAFDISQEGKNKALKLAAEVGVRINYEVGNFPQLACAEQKYDYIALVFAHFPPPVLANYHQQFVKMLNQGGLLILEGFSKNHLAYQAENPQAGGPKNVEMLFSVDTLKADFAGLEFLELEEKEVLLSEGQFHQGLSRVVRLVGRKTA